MGQIRMRDSQCRQIASLVSLISGMMSTLGVSSWDMIRDLEGRNKYPAILNLTVDGPPLPLLPGALCMVGA